MDIVCGECERKNAVENPEAKGLLCKFCASPLNSSTAAERLAKSPWSFKIPVVAHFLMAAGIIIVTLSIILLLSSLFGASNPNALIVVGAVLLNGTLLFALRRIVISTAASARYSQNIFRVLDKIERRMPEKPSDE